MPEEDRSERFTWEAGDLTVVGSLDQEQVAALLANILTPGAPYVNDGGGAAASGSPDDDFGTGETAPVGK